MLVSGLTAQVLITKKVTVEKSPISSISANKVDIAIPNTDHGGAKKLIRKKLILNAVKAHVISRKK